MRLADQIGKRAVQGRAIGRVLGAAGLFGAALAMAGCGNMYRPVVSAVSPVGPAAQATKYAVAISNTSTTTNPNSAGLVTFVDVSGDTVLTTAGLGVNPFYLILDTAGATGYVLNADTTVNSFTISTGLLTSNVLQTTLLAGAAPVSVLPEATNTYIAESGRGAVAQLTGAPPALRQELQVPSGSTPIYTVGINNAPRVYAISQGAGGSTAAGQVSAIETTSNTVSNTIPVGRGPVYGVMTSDARRAFILNKTDGTVSVINAQTNAPDTFTSPTTGTVTSTIQVGGQPIWADLIPTRSEMIVVNQGTATTAGTASIISIPLCSATSLPTNPNCDPNNPVDATGFGTVLATVPLGINPVMVSVLSDGTRAYVANAGNAGAGMAGSVSVVNLLSNTVTATIAGSNSTNEGDNTVHGHPGTIATAAAIPAGKVYITSPDSTDLTIIRTDTDTIQTHLSLQGFGVQVRVNIP